MTIAQQLNIKTFPFRIEVDSKEVYCENSSGYWYRREWQDGTCVCYETSEGYWQKREYKDGDCIYFENSSGRIEDNRPKSRAQAKVEQARKLLEEAEKELNDL